MATAAADKTCGEHQRVTRLGTKTAARPRMPLRQAIGQHMVFAYSGTTPPLALKRRIARGEAAGVILRARAAKGLERAVRSGALKRAEVEAGAQRVLRWRQSLVVGDGP